MLSLNVLTSNRPVSSKQRPRELVIFGSSSTISILAFFLLFFVVDGDEVDANF
jgi:hypothetical protein